MAERLRFIEHSRQRVLLIDFTRCPREEMLALLGDIQETITQEPRDSVLVLADFAGAEIDKEVAMRIKEALVFDRPFVKRSAWVGTHSLPKVFYENFKNFSQRDIPTFKTREEALDALTKA
jgi:hypothetical protein